MSLRALSAASTTLAPRIANHLWQSTLFVVLAAMLAFALRRNHARIRYWLWLTASLKFLIPFSLLVAAGSHLAAPRVSTPGQTIVYSAVEDLSQPFAAPESPVISQAAPAPLRVDPIPLLPLFAEAVWLTGIAVLAVMWIAGWIRISSTLRRAVAVNAGPEIDALRRVESRLGSRKPLQLMLSSDWMEPGVFGIFRQVLIWPEGISRHLDSRHIEAILAHEICHVRRRDNLTAFLHMLVQAIFWFHPLVWWMGAKLEAERERACDETVSLLCRQPKVYAESILRVCKFCSESPLACVSGITGADLKQRILQIMSGRVGCKLDLGRKFLLAAAALAAVAVPIALGQGKAEQRLANAMLKASTAPLRAMAQSMITEEPAVNSAVPAAPVHSGTAPDADGRQTLMQVDDNGTPAGNSPLGDTPILPQTAGAPAQPASEPIAFEMASIERAAPADSQYAGFRRTTGAGVVHISAGSASYRGITLKSLLMKAYGLGRYQVSGPAWIDSERYDVLATLRKDTPAADIPVMLQHLLTERFHLTLRSETRTSTGYALRIAQGGPKLQASSHAPGANGADLPDGIAVSFRFAHPVDFAHQADNIPPVRIGPTRITGSTMPALANVLTNELMRPVTDATGLAGKFDLSVPQGPNVTHDPAWFGGAPVGPDAPIFAALQELGLTLDPGTVSVPFIVVEKAQDLPYE